MQVFDYYDIPSAAAGQQQDPQARELARVRNMIKTAESTNYDGDPEYYGQIKALALQAGIPIKKFKSNPYRVAKAGLLSMADTALLGLIPNSMYTPHSEAEEMAIAAGTVGGMILPWGGAGALARGAIGGLKAMPRWSQQLAMRGLGQSNYRRAAQAYQGPGSFFKGGRGGSRFMRGGSGGGAAGGAATGPVTGPVMNTQGAIRLGAGNVPKQLPAPRSIQMPGQTGRPAGTPKKPVKQVNPRRNQTGTPGGPRPAGTKRRSADIKRNYQNKQATADRKAAQLKTRKDVKAGKVSIKMTRSGKVKDSDRLKLKQLMKSKYKRWQKLKGRSKQDFLMNWLRQKKIPYTVG